jgi:hypothetical protein
MYELNNISKLIIFSIQKFKLNFQELIINFKVFRCPILQHNFMYLSFT